MEGVEAGPDSPAETVDGILVAEGFERAERLGRFLVSAQPGDLERLLIGLRGERGNMEVTLGDAIFLRWMTVDAAGGLAFAEKEGFTSMAWWAWGKIDPDSALAAALENPQSWAGTMVMRAIAQSDPLRARELFDRYPQFAESTALGGLASGMMKVDPVAGATLAAAWNHVVDHENLVSGWARREPDAALAWAQGLRDRTKRAEAMGVVLDQLAAEHPEKVGRAIEEMPDGHAKWRLYAEHAKRLAATDPEAARAWAEAAPTPLLRREATVELARGLATANPTAALEALRGLDWSAGGDMFARQQILWPNGASYSGRGQLTDVVGEISAVAPAECLEFVTSLPDEAPVQQLVYSAFGTWILQDAFAASEWLAGQPDGAIRQTATQNLVQVLSGGDNPDFESAAQWAVTLPRENGVNGVVSRLFERWRRRDPEAAQAFLDGPDCPPEVRAAHGSPLQPQ